MRSAGRGQSLPTVGIDVACSETKRLPLCFVGSRGRRLVPLSIPSELRERIPRGLGNAEIKSKYPFRSRAAAVGRALERISDECGWNIECVAIDAPAAPPQHGPRSCERELSEAQISCYYTPDRGEWVRIKDECRRYLGAGKPLSGMPNANRIWMLYGFELFRALRALGVSVIETYPQAIVRHLLGDDCPTKLAKSGHAIQLGAVARATGWNPALLKTHCRPLVQVTATTDLMRSWPLG